jgi:hypothetical protein
VSNRAAVLHAPEFGSGRFRVTRTLRLTLQTGFIPLRKTKPYRLYKPASGGFQGETQVTKDEIDVADLERFSAKACPGLDPSTAKLRR